MLYGALAFLGPDQLGVFIPILAVVGWITLILTKHQQKMAQIIHGSGASVEGQEISQLRQEVYELKQMVHQQMIALDTYSGNRSRSADSSLQNRLGDQ